MIRMIIILLMLCFVNLIPSSAMADAPAKAENALPEFSAGAYDQNGKLVKVKAKGLVCEFCAKAIEKVFLRKDEVAAIHVNLTTKDIVINFKEGKMIDEEKLRKLIRDSGYNIESIDWLEGNGQ